MLRKILLTLGIAIVTSGFAYSQDGTIKGKVLGKDGKTPLEEAAVRLMQEGSLVLGTVTDAKGEFSLTPVPSGRFELIVSYPGLPSDTSFVSIHGSATRIVDTIVLGRTTLKTIKVKDKKEIIDITNPTKIDVLDRKDLQEVPTNSISGVLSRLSGVSVNSDGSISVRASRQSATYYVDGVPTRAVPYSAIETMSLISGAMPAEYGDGNAVVEIETRGPSQKVSNYLILSTYVDGHVYGGVETNTTGPIIKKKDKNGNDRNFFMGYMIGLSAAYNKGAFVKKGHYYATKETIDFLKDNPYRATMGNSSSIVARNVDYVTKYEEGNILSLSKKKSLQQQNAWSTSISIRPKIDMRASKNIDLSLGGYFAYGAGKNFNFANMLFNSENNGVSNSMSWEVNARFTHRLITEKATGEGKSKSQKIRNAYYRLIGYYMRGTGNAYSDIHKDNLFNYGYIGRFEHTLERSYEPVEKFTYKDEDYYDVLVQRGVPSPVAVNFTPFDLNPAIAKYTESAYERYSGVFQTDEDIRRYKGLLNGEAPESIYNMFNAPGILYNGVSKSLSEKMGGRAFISFEIRDHAIRIGFEYEQNVSKYHSVAPRGLWTRMWELANSHIRETDTIPIFVKELDIFGDSVFNNHINYNTYVDVAKQSYFDKSIRNKLGVSDTTWIDIHSFAPSDKFNDGTSFSLDMFSADELFREGWNSLINYYGYDYLGKKTINRATTMSDMKNWFDESNPDNKRDYKIGAMKPMKMSAYIQDKFTIRSLYLNLGLRLDIFNANQPYVKDMFLYRDAYTVKEAQASGRLSNESFIPDFMKNSDDYYVYVREHDQDASGLIVTAFRSGKTWYDKNGNEVIDPDRIVKDESVTQLLPFLKEEPGKSDISKVNYKAFAAYTPTFSNGGITLSPRIAFSFIVGENSVFSASYNVITSWSGVTQSFSPLTYLFFERFVAHNDVFPNPGLRPEKEINYEIVFKQKISRNLGMEFSAYYIERRDQVVAYQYGQAYPTTYISYTNMDFGTTQGFVFTLNMRADKRTTFSTNYTLQFVKGTGSTENSTINLIRSGAPNLRTLTNLNDDQRHKLNLTLHYGFENNDGPKLQMANKKTNRVKEIRWLQNTSADLTLSAGSGFPYTRSSVPFSSILDVGSRVVEGAINGSRMPWVLTGDLAIRKAFLLSLKKGDDGKTEKTGTLQLGLIISNVLGYKNQTSVYAYSGNRLDDGFLTAKEYQQYIAERENVASFIDYYRIRMEGLNPYGGPRTFSLQMIFDF